MLWVLVHFSLILATSLNVYPESEASLSIMARSLHFKGNVTTKHIFNAIT